MSLLLRLFATLRGRPSIDVAAQLARAVAAYRDGRDAEAGALCEALTQTGGVATADAWFLLGLLAERAPARDGAEAAFRRACKLRPDSGTFRLRLGHCLLRDADDARRTEATECFTAALDLLPEDSPEARRAALSELSKLEIVRGDLSRAKHWAQRGAAAGDTAARIRELMLVPAVTERAVDIVPLRRDLDQRLDALLAEDLSSVDAPERSIGLTPFYLAYHGIDDRPTMQRIAAVLRKVYRAAETPAAADLPRHGGRRKRIGFVSSYFYAHSIQRTTIGLVQGLPRSAFEVWTFSIAPKNDAMAAALGAASDRHVVLPDQLGAAVTALREAKLDALIFADLGMAPLTWCLAFWRLAPLQWVTWGHPITTGIDTLDGFISSRAIEHPAAQENYTEPLVLLDGFFMPAYARPAPPPSVTRAADLGLPADAHLYVCGQSLFKLHPDMDAAFGRILEADTRARIVLLGTNPHWVAQLQARFAGSLGARAARIHFVPPLAHAAYLGLLAGAHAVLDSFHFGGNNSNVEAFALGKPVVTLPTRWLRSRYTLGCYAEMGLSHLASADATAWADAAVRLACEDDFRHQTEAQVLARAGCLFERGDAAKSLGERLLETLR